MHISKIRIRNYKNLVKNEILFTDKINTVIGENGTGKTNIFNALRLVIDSQNRMFFSEESFSNELKNAKGHWIIISVHFDNVGTSVQEASLKADEQNKAVMSVIFRPKKVIRSKLNEMSVRLQQEKDNNEIIKLKLEIQRYIDKINFYRDYDTLKKVSKTFDFLDDNEYIKVVGDFDSYLFPNTDIQDDKKNIGDNDDDFSKYINFTFIPAIRDVNQELTKENNFVSKMLRNLASEIDDDEWLTFEEKINKFNEEMDSIPKFNSFINNVDQMTQRTVGNAYTSYLSLTMNMPNQRNNIIKFFNLKGKEEDRVINLYNRSLGDNNVIYFSLKLVESVMNFGNIDKIFNIMVIEEPEAHIHKFLQESLFTGLTKEKNLQLFLSTHSVYISESSKISTLIVLDKDKNGIKSYYPTKGLEEDEVKYLERYLDATKSPILFARSVLLVEGTAELLMIPRLFSLKYEIDFSQYGINIISLDGSFFIPITKLFHNDRLNKYVSVLTDLDQEIDGKETDKSRNAKNRVQELKNFHKQNDFVNISNSEYTFEIDFYLKNIEILKQFAKENKVFKTKCLIDELDSSDIKIVTKRIMLIVDKIGKGWLAYDFIKWIENNPIFVKNLIIPSYILEGIKFLLKNTMNFEKFKKIEEQMIAREINGK